MDGDMNDQQSAILKELSDIKASLAVNTNETANIKQALSEMKLDIKEIKNDFASRRELTQGLETIRNQIPSGYGVRLRRLELWGGIALGFIYALQFYFNFIKN